MDILFWIIAVTGHIGIWCAAFNQIHATAWPRSYRKNSELAILATVFIPLLILTLSAINVQSLDREQIIANNIPIQIYVFASAIAGVFFIVRWVWRTMSYRVPTSIGSHSANRFNIKRELGRDLLHGATSKWLGRIPFNQVQQLQTESFVLRYDSLPKQLEGLKICHLSDLHLTGQLDKQYFEMVVEKCNDFEPDLVVISGDLVDKVECLDWIPDVFGALISKLGVYYVLGNHDLRIHDEQAYRRRLEASGLKTTSGEWIEIDVNGASILLTGNELPWYPGAESLRQLENSRDSLKILISHSPDQLNWARQFGFDLMFAGHTHGGQIRFPIIGPVVAPSRYGIKYCSGSFQIDEMLMHVSRGISGDEQIRINCPPEVGFFTLRRNSSLN